MQFKYFFHFSKKQMSIWQTGELYLMPCTNDHDIAEKYKVVRNHGFERVHFMVNCSAEQMLMELVYPTQFDNPNLDYYCSFGQQPQENLEYTTEDGEVITFVDDQLLCNDQPMCESCFLIGRVTLIKHCSKHHKAKSLKRKGKTCKCIKAKRPCFNLPGKKGGVWCKHCPDKPPNAVNVKDKKCVCGKALPTFNLPGETIAIWCDNCEDKPSNAINVKNRMCPCGKRPNFNLPGETIGLWCNNCEDKPPNAVDVKHKKCSCGKRPTFNVPGETIAIWCFTCEDKPLNAVDVVNKKCPCGKIPTFNVPGETIAIWCDNCENNPPNAIDVRHRLCICGETRANFNITGETPKYCWKCRKLGMVPQPLKKCKLCKNLAIFGIDNQRYHCEEHKTDDEFNLVERPCESCGLMEVLDNNNICRSCDPTNFKKYIKRKEYQIKDLLDAHKFKYTHDKISNGTKCGRERPDFVFKFDDHIVILEVDENQHTTYPQECEKIRMFNITQSFGGVPVFWIRYNPDDFKTSGAKKKSKIVQNKREQHLINCLKWSFQREMQNLGEVLYLFYDGCNEKTFESDISVLTVFENQ
jgi:hypothetical protein